MICVVEEAVLKDGEEAENEAGVWKLPDSPGSLVYEYEGDSQIHDPIGPSLLFLYCIIAL